jgi:hypothetical protein
LSKPSPNAAQRRKTIRKYINNTNVPASQVILRAVLVHIMAATVMNTSFSEQIGTDGIELPFCWMNIEQDHQKL